VFVWVVPRHVSRDALRDELLSLLLEPVGEPFQEQQAKDVVLVVAAVDEPTQDVGGRPQVTL